MIAELKRLREHCLGVVAQIDAILPQCADLESPIGQCRPLVVEGKCREISQHAIERYRERTGTTKGDASICKRVFCRLETAKEMRLLDRYRVIELLAHGTPARYFRSHDLFFVVENEIIVTVHHGTADRWEPIPEPATPAP